ncbi:MAG TPA: STAS domain-containing protein [Actinomycetota bacterium]|nr:STAS domain-containing protein [Actinomycetota bacterium]
MTDLASITVEDHDDGSVIHVRGEIDLSNASRLSDAIERSISNEATSVTIDLTETTYLDSAGIQLLFTLATRLGTRRRHLAVIAPEGGVVRGVLDVTGVPQVMEVRSSL